MKRSVLGLVVAVVILGGLTLFLCCKPQADSGGGKDMTSENVLWRNELFDFAMDELLNRMDDFHSAERQQTTLNRLDQWVRMQKPLEDWKPDPLIAGVTEELRSGAEQTVKLAERIGRLQQRGDAGPLDTLPGEFRSAGEHLNVAGARLALTDVRQAASQMITTADQLDEMLAKNAATADQGAEVMRAAFSQFNVNEFGARGDKYLALADRIDPSILAFPGMDSVVFQEAVWLSNIATWGSGTELDDPVKPAAALFDWVVKNVDLTRESQVEGSNSPVRVLQSPVETLLFGKGTGIDRAWLFVLLARQMNIDAALLALPGEDNSAARLWGVGVLIEGEVYLFEPVLGVPVPKLGSLKLTDKGLTCEPATLAEAAADDAVLRQLDVLQEGDYAVEAKDMQEVMALVEASPAYLSQRMKMVERRLAGDEKIVLTTDASAQLARFMQCPNVVGGQLWSLPYQTLWQAIRLGPERAQWLSVKFKPFIFPPNMPLLWKARSYHFKGQFTGDPSATSFYLAARLSDFAKDSAQLNEQDRQQWQEIKIDASYWLGLLVAQTGNDRAAKDYFENRVLKDDPGGKWEYGAAYNLARVLEATGDIPKAIKIYQVHLAAPQTQGNLLRARWLMKLTGQEGGDPAPKADGSAKPKEAEKDEAPSAAAKPEPGDMKGSAKPKEAKAETPAPAEASQQPAEEKETPATKEEKPAEETKEEVSEKAASSQGQQ